MHRLRLPLQWRHRNQRSRYRRHAIPLPHPLPAIPAILQHRRGRRLLRLDVTTWSNVVGGRAGVDRCGVGYEGKDGIREGSVGVWVAE